MTVEDMDAEANAFALELLMPSAFLIPAAAEIDLMDERAVARLAKLFKVDPLLLAFRLGVEFAK